MTEWKWTILDVLEQPEQELAAVMALKYVGNQMHKQSGKQNQSDGMETY